MGNDLDEIRKLILSVDTTFDLGDSTTEGFLPPNFYIDRLVKVVEHKLAQEANKAVIDALQSLEAAREETKGADSFISKYITKYIRELTAEKGKA